MTALATTQKTHHRKTKMKRMPKPASKGERELIRCCERYGINVVCQKSFPDLRGTRGGLLRFDMFTTNTQPPFLIEYQGKGTHGKEAITSFGHSNGLRRISHDKIKRDYCKHHRIPLLCISYRESIPKALQHFIKVKKINIMKPKPVVTKTKPSWSFFAIVLLIVLFGTLAKPET
jgi:hypothetical protein